MAAAVFAGLSTLGGAALADAVADVGGAALTSGA